ncbi:MAG: hypothetical protein ACXWCS_15365, partial [Burkholderiales bacterium]
MSGILAGSGETVIARSTIERASLRVASGFNRRLFETRGLQRAAAKGARAMTTLSKADHRRAELEQERL